MLEAVPLIAVTILFISIFLYAYANLQLSEIRANWNVRRCETLVMLLANMVPTDPAVDTSDFAAENFSFCIGKIIDSSLSIFLQPMMTSFSKQIDATKPISDSMSYLKNMAFSLLGPLLSMFGGLWGKFKGITFEVIRVYYNLHSAMDRIFGIAAASLFAGMGLFNAIKNGMGFVIQVVIAILTILCILVVFLFFVMWPVIPIILTMIGILSATVYSANVSGMSGSFCVAGNTRVKVKNGWKRADELVAGDELDEGSVEGVLKVEGNGGCVAIDGIVISKSHLVFHEEQWISAEEHPLAIPAESPATLYCLNTSTRLWTVMSDIQSEFILRDWEEIPDDCPELDFAWESLISSMLNDDTAQKPLRKVAGRGLLGPQTFLWTDRIGTNTPITQIKIGDYVRDKEGFTRVLGIYNDTSTRVPLSGPNDAIWYYMPIKKLWAHPKERCHLLYTEGYHLITESGTFKIGFGRDRMLVRDFTEVGAKRIHETYPFIKSVLF